MDINYQTAATAFDTPYYLVKATATNDEVELTSSRSDRIQGVSSKPLAAGGAVIQQVVGLVKLIAEGAIAKNAPICPSDTTNGAAEDASQVDENDEVNIVGFALESATDGDEFHALLLQSPAPLLVLSAAAEAANAIAVTIAANRPGTFHYLASILETDGTLGDTAAFTLAETGDGAEVSTTAKGHLVISSSSAGAAEVTVTDVAGTYTGDVFLLLQPLNHEAPTAMIKLTFA